MNQPEYPNNDRGQIIGYYLLFILDIGYCPCRYIDISKEGRV